MTIRKATIEDLPAVVEMALAMASYHHDLDGYYKAPSAYRDLELEFEKELSDKQSLILIAEENGQPAGYFRGSIERAPDYASAKKIGMVYDLFVKKEARRQGIGKQIFAEALAWFQEKGVKNIELNVDVRNEAAVEFWKKNQFLEYKLRMRRYLTGK